jgi:DNA replication protein DnaC
MRMRPYLHPGIGRGRPPEPLVIFKKAPDTLPDMLGYLNLPVTLETYKTLLAQAGQDNLSHEEFLKRLLSNEAAAKFERQITSRLRQARFPCLKTLDTFDWNHPTSIPKAKILEAFELRFLEKNEGLVFMASHGLGKTHLATALGHRAARAGVRTLFTKAVDMVTHLAASQADHSQRQILKLYTHPSLLIIDELGRLSMDQKQGEYFFQVIDARYERGSTVITTNRAFKDWGKIFHDMVCAKGIIDRLVHHSDVIKIEGTSYRLKDRKTQSLADAE